METTFSAPAIVCGGCADTIRKALEPIPGVSRVDVDVASKLVTITHDERTTEHTLAAALAAAGYPGTVTESGGAGSAQPASSHHAHGAHHHGGALITIGALTVKDPVCGMSIDPAHAAGTSEHDGKTVHFCSKSCKQKFDADPARYHTAGAAHSHNGTPPAEEPAAGTTYTCPMHPEIIRDRPGSCPICGMALEPVLATADDGPNPELVEMSQRFWVCLALSAPLLLLTMSEMIPGLSLAHLLPAGVSSWVQLALATPVVVWGGWPFFVRGWSSVLHRSLNMFTLIALGTGAAFLYSVVATLLPGIFPPAFRQHDGQVPVYFEASAVIVTLVLLGQVLELRARSQTSGAIKALLRLAPKTARRLRDDGTEEDVPLEHVQVGDQLRVRPGEKVPVDGVVVSGTSAVDEALVTGESMPVEKAPGAPLIGGSVNGTGSLVMRAERVGSGTLLARIVKMVGDAQRTKAPIQRLADTVSGYFVPAVILIAVLAFIAWALVGPPPRMTYAIVSAVSVLIIACPCALGLATPMSIMVGTGRGALEGVLIRNAEALQTLEKIDTIVVDKTGTLTEGKPKLVSVVAVDGQDEAELLRLAASLERGSEHPVASAITAGARERGVSFSAVEGFQSTTGKGVEGTVDGRAVSVGSAAFLNDLAGGDGGLAARAEALRREGQTVVFVAIDGRPAGLLGVADPIKPSTAAALKAVRSESLRIVMLTGDSRTTAEAVARSLGITEIRAEVLPDQKGEVIRQLQAEGRVVAMAGDGVNDAPALAQAQVGIAMGTGTDVAMESAGVTLVKGDLRGIVRAVRLSRATMRNIRQNLAFAFFYNALGVPVAAGLLYPVLGQLLHPMIASAAMTLSSVSVIMNALRLRWVALDD